MTKEENFLDKISRVSIVALIYAAVPLLAIGVSGILITYIIKLITGER